MKVPTTCLALVAVLLLACSPGVESVCDGAGGTEEERAELVGQVPAAVVIYGEDPGRKQWGFCSGVLVGKSTVLTAAHCLHDRQGWTFEVSFAADFAFKRSDASAVPVFAWDVHPEWDPVREGEFDVALLQLESTAPTEPLPWTADSPSTAVGAHYTFVGYGGQEGDRTQCLRVSNDVTGVELEVSPVRIRAFVHPNIYYGDSGGPLLVDLGSGPIVLGVLAQSTFIGSDVAYGSLTYFAKLQDGDWLRAALPSEPVALRR
jgi:secreted trypsin-like serine protease